jgi:hypothetical protein
MQVSNDSDAVVIHALGPAATSVSYLTPNKQRQVHLGYQLDGDAEVGPGTRGITSFSVDGNQFSAYSVLPVGNIASYLRFSAPTENVTLLHAAPLEPLSFLRFTLKEEEFFGLTTRFSLNTDAELTANLVHDTGFGDNRKVRSLFEGGQDKSAFIQPHPTLGGSGAIWSGSTAAPGGPLTFIAELSLDSGTLALDASKITLMPDANGLISGTMAFSTNRRLDGVARSALFRNSSDHYLADELALQYLYHPNELGGFSGLFHASGGRFECNFGRDTFQTMLSIGEHLTASVNQNILRGCLHRIASEPMIAHFLPGQEHFIKPGMFFHEDVWGATSGVPSNLAFDYHMVDTTFLVSILTEELIRDSETRDCFLNRDFLDEATPTIPSERLIDKLLANIDRVVSDTSAFAADPSNSAHLIRFLPGHTSGSWRDGEDGDHGTVYPMYVSCALVPGALRSSASLIEKLRPLYPELDERLTNLQTQAQGNASVWERHAIDHFRLQIPNDQLRLSIENRYRALGVSPTSALDQLGSQHLDTYSIGLYADQTIARTWGTDVGYVMALTKPSPDVLTRLLNTVEYDFGFGIRFPGIGYSVAVTEEVSYRPNGTNDRYQRERTIWPSQEAMLVKGLQTQLARTDLPSDVHGRVAKCLANIQSDKESFADSKSFETILVNPDGKGGWQVGMMPPASCSTPQLWNYVGYR